eukprot:scaffold35329_cov44-Attheya_sp.AAC.2
MIGAVGKAASRPNWGSRIRRVAGASVASSLVAAWYYRPIADPGGGETGPDRSNQVFCSPSLETRRHDVPLLLSAARALSIGITTVAIRFFMNTYGTFQVVDDAQYQNFLQIVLGREKDQGLITVSNHRSLFDDPGVVSGILPWWITLQPKYNRWGICSQEYCFNDVLPGIIKGYIGAGQVLPICRGAGINQKLLLDFAKLVAQGDWCHVFPEGGVWQLPGLGGLKSQPGSGGRGRSSSGLGKLRWGVGKLIAHSPMRPRVIPFAHAGMESLIPQDPVSGKSRFGHEDPLRVLVRFGQELHFDDLIETHEAKHGTLWTYDALPNNNRNFHRKWDSSPAEYQLYSKIADRIEQHLEVLSTNVVEEHSQKTKDNGWQHPIKWWA